MPKPWPEKPVAMKNPGTPSTGEITGPKERMLAAESTEPRCNQARPEMSKPRAIATVGSD
jgi:hypothetical protein